MLSQEIIDKAILGDEESLCAVVQHYMPYIKKYSMEPIIYEDGKSGRQVNAELEGEIISHLIAAILKLEGKNNDE